MIVDVFGNGFDVNSGTEIHERVGGDDGQPLSERKLDGSRRGFEVEGKELLAGLDIT